MSTESTGLRAAFYLRKSSVDPRAGANRSITDQRFDCDRLVERHGLVKVKEFEEKVGTSASHIANHPRPKYDLAMAEMGKTYDVLVAYHSDRLVREGMLEMGQLFAVVEKADGRFVTGDGHDTKNPASRMFGAMSAEQNRAYVQAATDATRRGKEGARRRGSFCGGAVPFGWLRDPAAEYGVSLDHAAVPIIQEMIDRLIDGATLREACRWMNDEGHRTRNGSLWEAGVLRRFVRSVHLIGHLRQLDSVFTDDDGNPVEVLPPIISPVKAVRVVRALQSRRRNTADPSKPTKFRPATPSSLLGGLVRCGDCSRSMYAEGGSHGTGPKGTKSAKYAYYTCQHCGSGKRHTVRSDYLETYVARWALHFLSSLEPGSEIMDVVANRMLASFTPEQVNRREEIENELSAIQTRLSKFRMENLKAGMEDAEYDRLAEEATILMNGLREELETLPQVETDLTVLRDLTVVQVDPDADIVGPDSAWAEMEHHRRRSILRVLVDEVVIERRDGPSVDIEGRTTVITATEDNVVELASRPDRRPSYSTPNFVAVAAG